MLQKPENEHTYANTDADSVTTTPV